MGKCVFERLKLVKTGDILILKLKLWNSQLYKKGLQFWQNQYQILIKNLLNIDKIPMKY